MAKQAKQPAIEKTSLSQDELDALPDYTDGAPGAIAVGARWKVLSEGRYFIGEMVSEGQPSLKIVTLKKVKA